MSARLETLLLNAEQLAGFGDWLRGQDFRVGTQQLVQAQQLLVRLAAAGLLPDQPAGLTSHLGPLFCATPEQQQRFPELFKEWLAAEFGSPTVAATTGDQPRGRSESSATQRPGWRWFLGAGALALCLIGDLVAAYFWWPQQLPGWVKTAEHKPAAGAQISFGSTHLAAAADGRFTLPFRRIDPPQTLTVTLAEHRPFADKIRPTVGHELVVTLTPLPIPKNTNATVIATNVPAATTNAPAPAANLQPVQRLPRPWQQHARFAAYASSPVVLLLLWWGVRRAWRRVRGRPHLARVFTETPASLREVRVSGAAVTLLPGLGVNELGRELRRRRRVHSRELDLPATLTATLHQGGLLSPVFGSRVEPNYLVLIDRASLQDHQAALTALVVDTLLLGNVSVERYYYDGDPGFCRRADDRTGEATAVTVTLEELAARLPEHRLLLFSDGAGFFDGFTGQPAGWVRLLAAWEDKAILTPEPPQHWGRREWAIERLGFLLLPITRAGLTLLGDFFRERPVVTLAPAAAHQTVQPSFARHPARWLDREPPAPEQVTKLCEELRANLGETAFHWLCACAVYPEVLWSFTIRLGAALVPDERKFEELLPRLARLVWLREAYLPDWFRAALLERLPEVESRSVRQVLTTILAQAGTAPGDAIPLRIATDEPAPPRGGHSRWHAVREWLLRRRPAQTVEQAVRHAAPDSPLADHVFVRFMSGRRDPALLLPVPPALLQRLYPHGAVLYGLRGSVALTFAALLSLAVMVGLETFVELPPPLPGLPAATKEQPWVNSLGMKFVPVAGTPVLFGVWDVRVQDYAAFASATGRAVEEPSFEQDPTHPVVNVNWNDAQDFAKWLTEKEQREGKLAAGLRYRLPQDWEWSVAVGLNEARAGTPKDKDMKTEAVYPWGTQWPPPKGAGNFADETAKTKKSVFFGYIDGYDDGYAWTSPVGSFTANSFGLYDMGGNVWQWCEDFYEGKSGDRLVRGGSWDINVPRYLLSSYRIGVASDIRGGNFGFRLVLVGVGGVR